MPDEAELLAFLDAQNAGRAPHAHGRVLLDHLIGTRRIAQAWGAPQAVADAALFHSVYGTDVYAYRSVSLARRDEVRRLIGDRAERLARAFSQIDRRMFRESVRANGAGRPLVVALADGSDAVTLAPADVFALLVLYMANEFEQTCAADGSPAPVLSTLAGMGRFLEPAFGTVPRVVAEIGSMTPADDDDLVATYARTTSAYTTAAQIDPRAFDALARRFGFVAEVRVWAACEAARSERFDHAAVHLDAAERRFATFGAPWDKRRSLAAWSRAIGTLRGVAATSRSYGVLHTRHRDVREFLAALTSP